MNSGIIALLVITCFSYALTADTFPGYAGRPNYDNIPQCMQPPEAGLCLAYIPSYYYNPATKKCDSFIYGGCQGNKNRFISENDCMQKCGGSAAKSRLEDTEQKENDVDVCSQPKDSGYCYGLFERYYFNGQKCEIFSYGGCMGNDNNFETEEECEKACPPKTTEQ